MGADQHFFTCVCVCARASPAAPHAAGVIVFIRNGALPAEAVTWRSYKFTRVDIVANRSSTTSSFKHAAQHDAPPPSLFLAQKISACGSALARDELRCASVAAAPQL